MNRRPVTIAHKDAVLICTMLRGYAELLEKITRTDVEVKSLLDTEQAVALDVRERLLQEVSA